MLQELYMTDVHKGREVVYSCLSRIFLNIPSVEIYKMLETLLPFFEEMATDDSDDLMTQGYNGIKIFLESRKKLSGEELKSFDEDVVRCFTRLYCLTDSVPVSESVYTSVSHLTNEGATGEVKKLYDACDFNMNHLSNEPSDHISYEFMFMSYLAKGTYKHIEKGNMEEADKLLNLQKQFLNNHILKWLKDFVKATVNFEESYSLYAPISYFALGYTTEDNAFLSE